MTHEQWSSMTPDQRYMLVTTREEPEEYFRTVVSKSPLLILGVSALLHHVKSQPEYQAGV